MATTTTLFASGNYKVGTQTSATANCPAGISDVLLSIDRTAGAHSLNSQPATTTVHCEVQVQVALNAAGDLVDPAGPGVVPFFTTFATVELAGGVVVDPDTGLAVTATTLEWASPMVVYAARFQVPVRAIVTVAGATVSLAASLTLS